MASAAAAPKSGDGAEQAYPDFPWSVAQRFGGMVGMPYRIWKQDLTGTDLYIHSAPVPNLSFSYDGVTNWSGESLRTARLAGTGASTHEPLSRLKAIAEAAERYATSILLDGEFRYAAARELGGDTLDWTILQLCPAVEGGREGSAIAPFDPDQRIRWVKGWCLIERREKYVPAVMTHLFPRPQRQEMFWIPISTGVAAHTDLLEAAVSAVGEVVERDAIALNWLTNRALPRIVDPALTDPAARILFEEAMRSDTQYSFFDATTDLGVPTVYAIETNRSDPVLTNTVACSTDFSAGGALAGAVRELASSRYAFQRCPGPVAERPEECTALEDGARYMALAERSGIFDRLKATEVTTNLASYAPLANLSARDRLNELVARIGKIGRDLVLVDLTTDDLRERGLVVVRAVIPALMPMSTVYRFRCLGHPRLIPFGRAHVRPDFSLEHVNPMPQPFA